MGCFSGRLMSTASDQKLFCKLSSPFCCSFDEFVEEKVISPSYSSAILTPLSWVSVQECFLPLSHWWKTYALQQFLILDPRIFSVPFPRSNILLLPSSSSNGSLPVSWWPKSFLTLSSGSWVLFLLTKSSGSLSGFWGWEGFLLILRRINFCIMRERSKVGFWVWLQCQPIRNKTLFKTKYKTQ